MMIYLEPNGDPIPYNPAYDEDPIVSNFYDLSDSDQIDELIEMFGSKCIAEYVYDHFELELSKYEEELTDLFSQCNYKLIVSFCRDEIKDLDIAGYLTHALEDEIPEKLHQYADMINS